MDFLADQQLNILRWLHIVAMVYWLGGEWGVFQTSYKVINPKLTLEERQRHMDTAYRIDILARLGIISLLPLGLHMGHLWGMWGAGQDVTGALWLIWIVYFAVLGVTLGAFFTRGQPIWHLLSGIEDWTRYIAIPTLLFVSIASLMGNGPFEAGEGQKWYAAKMLTFGLMLCIGVILRLVMHEWQKMFAVLAKGPNAEVEAKLKSSIGVGRSVAYVYWIGIATTGFFGAVKPF